MFVVYIGHVVVHRDQLSALVRYRGILKWGALEYSGEPLAYHASYKRLVTWSECEVLLSNTTNAFNGTVAVRSVVPEVARMKNSLYTPSKNKTDLEKNEGAAR